MMGNQLHISTYLTVRGDTLTDLWYEVIRQYRKPLCYISRLTIIGMIWVISMACAQAITLSPVGLTHTVSQTQTVDVNTASVQQLTSIKGIGQKTAQRILSERKRAGLFASFEDLSRRVRGMNKKKLRKLHMQGLRVGGSHINEGGLPQPSNGNFPPPTQEKHAIKHTKPRIAEGQILYIKTP